MQFFFFDVILSVFEWFCNRFDFYVVSFRRKFLTNYNKGNVFSCYFIFSFFFSFGSNIEFRAFVGTLGVPLIRIGSDYKKFLFRRKKKFYSDKKEDNKTLRKGFFWRNFFFLWEKCFLHRKVLKRKVENCFDKTWLWRKCLNKKKKNWRKIQKFEWKIEKKNRNKWNQREAK